MRNLKMTVSYDGSEFNGFQAQPIGRTVQGELERAIRSIVGHEVKIIGSGRTDAGVHAYGQVFNFLTHMTIPVERWPFALNTKLPDGIIIRSAEEVNLEFHARHFSKRKIYRYAICNSQYSNVFRRKYEFHISRYLDFEAMSEAAKYLVGTYDFTSFRSTRSTVRNHVRTIYRSEWVRDGETVYYYVEGDGFLYNMVRIIIGTMIQIGDGKKSAASMPSILAAMDRNAAGPTAPAHGLTLWQVMY
jgi:tRNA pseudouridine38-40 synthase